MSLVSLSRNTIGALFVFTLCIKKAIFSKLILYRFSIFNDLNSSLTDSYFIDYTHQMFLLATDFFRFDK